MTAINRIADAIVSDSRIDVGDVLESLPAINELIFNCARCESWSFFDDGTNVDDSHWCESCTQEHAHHWESDGAFHDEPEPVDDDDCDDYGIPEYHVSNLRIPAGILARPDVLGIELETYWRDVNHAAGYLSQLRTQLRESLKFERDSSIDERHGIEIVCSPWRLADIRAGLAPWKGILETARRQSARAWDAGDSYGMHVSLNGSIITEAYRARIVRFINSNRTLCESFARRPQNRWAEYRPKDKLSAEARASESSHYDAAHLHDNGRIEIRIFRASLQWESFVRACEFCDAVRVYCADCGFNGLTAAGFTRWLAAPSSRATWPIAFAFSKTIELGKGALCVC